MSDKNKSKAKKPAPQKLSMQLRTQALKLAKIGIQSVGYSKDEAAYRASGMTQNILRPFQRHRQPALDLCMVIPDKSRGWILEAVCKEIGQFFDGKWEISGKLERLPRARAYFFCHYHFYLTALKQNPMLNDSRSVVWLTHPKEENLGGPATLFALQGARVVTMCSMWRDYVISLGLKPAQVSTIVGAADPEFFQPHQRGSGKVGFCTAYYDRKSPQRIVDLVRAKPEVPFVLMGRNWDKYPDFAALKSLPNFEYREGNYSQYPAFYNELDVFVSLSELEGGPIPLIESMMSNVVPVATKTGFAPDVIRHGQNGYLCNTDASTEEVSRLVDQALRNKNEVRNTVSHLSWRRFSELMQVEMGLRESAPAEKIAG